MFALSSGGAILSQSTRDRLVEHMPNLMIIDGFGASEVGYTGAILDGSSPETGLPFQSNERVGVISDSGRLLEPGADEIGRVAQRGHLPLEYYKDAAKTRETFVEVDGQRWVLLGDRATIDADGVIRFLGRGSVCINSGGEKVYPEEVEAAIKAHDAVRDVVVAGVPDPRWGQRVGAVVELRSGASLSREELHAHLDGRIARYKLPQVVHHVHEIERSPTGKCDYRWAVRVLSDAADKDPVGVSPAACRRDGLVGLVVRRV